MLQRDELPYRKAKRLLVPHLATDGGRQSFDFQSDLLVSNLPTEVGYLQKFVPVK